MCHITLHFFPLDFFFLGYITKRATSSNTCVTFSCVRALHSMNLSAPTSCAKAWPCRVLMQLLALSLVLKSILVPTNRTGTSSPLWWRSSGIHLQRTLSTESFSVNEKQTMNTSVYTDMGRFRSLCGKDKGQWQKEREGGRGLNKGRLRVLRFASPFRGYNIQQSNWISFRQLCPFHTDTHPLLDRLGV